MGFTVKDEAFFALLGPNGAGKSTTVEMLSTLKTPTGGNVKINGPPLGKDDDAIRKSIGVVFQYSTLDGDLTVREILRLRGRFFYQDRLHWMRASRPSRTSRASPPTSTRPSLHADDGPLP